MLTKLTDEEEDPVKINHKRKLWVFSRIMAWPGSYRRMDKDTKSKKRVKFMLPEDAEGKKRKRSWKKIRRVAMSTCRYLGLGVAHMSPATLYTSPDYYIDPACWNRSFSSTNYPNKSHTQPQHWTNNMMFISAW